MDKIINNLYVGNASSAKFALNKFDLIVNCTENIPVSLRDSFHDSPNGKVTRIPIDDLKEDNQHLLRYLPSVTQEIHQVLSNNGRVLIHCQQGASRSCSVAAAYLIRYFDRNVEEAVKFMQSKRAEAFFCNNVVFREALEKFQILVRDHPKLL